MRHLEPEAGRLASAILAGEFQKKGILARTIPLVSGPKTWLKRLMCRVFRKFSEQRPRRRALVTFLLSSRSFSTASEHDDFAVLAYAAPAEFLPANTRWSGIELIPLNTFAAVGQWLGLTEQHLLWLADRRQLERTVVEGPLRNYRYRWVLKRRGSCRLIEAPKQRLCEVQRELLKGIFEQIPVHAAAHGFRKGHSTATHSEPHVGKAIVLKMDLQDFFPSIAPSRLVRILMHAGYPEEVAETLTALCCNHTPADVWAAYRHNDDWKQRRATELLYRRPHFPQGAPTSPAIANICVYRLDCRLAGLARKANAVYTRYADDLLFSGDDEFARSIDRFRIFVAAVVIQEGFFVNHHKTMVMSRSVRQHAVGLVLNQKLNVARREFDRLKAILHQCTLRGPALVNADNPQHSDFRRHLRGRIEHIGQWNSARAEKLLGLFNRIDWTDKAGSES